jgi:hypothetical protein
MKADFRICLHTPGDCLYSVKSHQSRVHRKEQLDWRTLYLQAPPPPCLLILSSMYRKLLKTLPLHLLSSGMGLGLHRNSPVPAYKQKTDAEDPALPGGSSRCSCRLLLFTKKTRQSTQKSPPIITKTCSRSFKSHHLQQTNQKQIPKQNPLLTGCPGTAPSASSCCRRAWSLRLRRQQQRRVHSP